MAQTIVIGLPDLVDSPIIARQVFTESGLEKWEYVMQDTNSSIYAGIGDYIQTFNAFMCIVSDYRKPNVSVKWWC